METKEAYRQKVDAQMKEWNAQIALLAAKLENAGADVKVKYAQELDAIRAKQRVAAAKVKELDAASGEAWESVKATSDKVWEDLKAGIGQAMSRFR